jgi:hypothetical protein
MMEALPQGGLLFVAAAITPPNDGKIHSLNKCPPVNGGNCDKNLILPSMQ